MDPKHWLKDAQETLEEAIQEKLAKCKNKSELEEAAQSISSNLENIIPGTISELTKSLVLNLEKDRERHVQEIRELNSGFEERNYERWKPAFDRLQALITVCIEVGDAHRAELGEQAEEQENYVFFALLHLHTRALLISNEIMALLRTGYPDGALGRWRSLHEINVYMAFIAKHGNGVAERFFANFEFQALRAMQQLNAHAERASLDPFDEQEIENKRQQCQALENIYGKSLKEDLGWAAEIIGKNRANLRDLEQDVGLDHWRPRSKWASQNIHAAFRLGDKMLGMTEAKKPVNLVGASNSGFVDPIHMTAISLSGSTTHFLLLEKDLGRVSITNALQLMCDEIGDVAVKRQKETLEDFRASEKKA